MKEEKAGVIASIFIGVLLSGLFGGLLYFKLWPDYQVAKESVNWPRTQGTVLRSEVVTHRDDDGIKYSADILYTYEVKGRQYKSSQIYSGSDGVSSGSSKGAYRSVGKYPVGKKIDVYYSDTEPANALLETGTNKTHYIIIGVIAVFFFLGLFLLFSGLLKMVLVMAAITGGLSLSFFRFYKKKHPQEVKRNHRTRMRPPQGGNTKIDLDDELADFNKVSASSPKSND